MCFIDFLTLKKGGKESKMNPIRHAPHSLSCVKGNYTEMSAVCSHSSCFPSSSIPFSWLLSLKQFPNILKLLAFLITFNFFFFFVFCGINFNYEDFLANFTIF